MQHVYDAIPGNVPYHISYVVTAVSQHPLEMFSNITTSASSVS